MLAKDLREMSIHAAKVEIEEIESNMVRAAKKGELKLIVTNLSPAARTYFTDKGFKCKLYLDTTKTATTEGETPWAIIWEDK